MKEITSVKTGKIQIVPDEVWNDIVSRGWKRKYKVKDIEPKVLKSITPPEIKKKHEKH